MNDAQNSMHRVGRTPDDAQVDQLLRTFFVHEVPQRLSQPLDFAVIRHASSNAAVSELSGADAPRLTIPLRAGGPVPAGSPSRWIAVSVSVVAMTVCLLIAAQLGPITGVSGPGNSMPASGGAGGVTTGSELPSANTPATPGDRSEETILVSPGSGPSGTSAMPIGDDGVTLEETDGVDLNPQPGGQPRR